ncbi:sorting nexin-24 isoform X2 [Danio aesculapii]|uniref:sorting nexin-24 isoform X2 n=1 Tax=Danio aesculapii TaxID=1142201 RepID=UPI0024BFA1FE|nr:sorting nexin-24 isoform X2 [Danio aesculapii]
MHPIEVSIPSFRSEGSSVEKGYTVFKIEVLMCGRQHTVEKRYSEFHALHKMSSRNPSLGNTHTHSLTHTLRTIQPSQFTCTTCLWTVGKPEHPEETHTNAGRTCKLYTETPIDPAEARTSNLHAVRRQHYLLRHCVAPKMKQNIVFAFMITRCSLLIL